MARGEKKDRNGGIYPPERAERELMLRPFLAASEKQPPAADKPHGIDSSKTAGELLDAPAERDAAAVIESIINMARESGGDTPLEQTQDEENSGGESPGEASRGAEPTAAQRRRRKVITEKQRRIRERRKKRLKLLTAATAAVAFTAAALLAYFLLIVDSIEIYGAQRFTADDILALSGLRTGRHIWLQNISDAKEGIEGEPYIAEAVISRSYPDTIVIRVSERTEKAVIVGMNTHAVIDGEGYVLYIGARADYAGLVKITGASSGGYEVNQRLGEESDYSSRTLVALLAAVVEANLTDVIEYIDISNPLSVYLTTYSGLAVHFGQSEDAGSKLEAFKTVLPTLVSMGRDKTGVLDLSAKGDPVYSPPASEAAQSAVPEASPAEGDPAPGGSGGGSDPLEPGRTPDGGDGGFSG